MKARYIIPIGFFCFLILGFGNVTASPEDSTDQSEKSQIGITLMGGYNWPWMDWTRELKRDSSNSKRYRHEKLIGPNVKREMGGVGIVYRLTGYSLRLSLQYGKTVDMIYHQEEAGWLNVADTTTQYEANDRPMVGISQYTLSLSYMKYRRFLSEKMNFYYGGGASMTVLKLFNVPRKHYSYDPDTVVIGQDTTLIYRNYTSQTDYINDNDWGFGIFPLVGLEYRVTPKLGINVECQYTIGSSFNEKYADEYRFDKTQDDNEDAIDKTVSIKDNWSYHFNTNGISIQGGLYYYMF